jgi:hypothetical protein
MRGVGVWAHRDLDNVGFCLGGRETPRWDHMTFTIYITPPTISPTSISSTPEALIKSALINYRLTSPPGLSP